VLCEALRMVGLIFAIMPVSESGVERIFSHLRNLLLPHRDRMDAELVQARLLIKLNHHPDETTCEERLRHLDRVDPAGCERFPIPTFGNPLSGPASIPGFASREPVAWGVEPASQPEPRDVPRFPPPMTFGFRSRCDRV
jgi:hypothetical protein